MAKMNDNKETRVSLDGLTPEEALKALLAVQPDEHEQGNGSDGADGSDDHGPSEVDEG